MSSDFDPSEFVTIPEGWTCKRLIDCTIDDNLSYGIVQPGQHVSNGIPVIRINNINNGQLDLQDVLKVDPEIEKKYQRTRLEGGEVLLTLVGSTGQSFVAPPELKGWNVPRAIAVIRADQEIGSDWINICLQSKETKHFLDVRANTTVQKTLNLKDVRDIPILLPPKEVKELIEGIATSIAKKIELNRKTNQTLEQIAQALFKSWFVDFEPTRAKIVAKEAGASPEEIERAAMCAISGKTPDQLAQLPSETQQNLKNTAALFPATLEDSELGEVPEGWEVKSLSDIAQYANGKIEVSKLHLNNYISTENMLGNRGGINAATSLPSVPTVPSFSPNQILISNIRPYFKKIWLARFDGGRSNDVLGFVAKEKGCEEFLYNLLYQDEFFEFMMRTSKGAKMPRGDKDAIADWKFVCASKASRLYFSEIIRPSYSTIESLNFESMNLSNARDKLLPKLLSGEIQLQNDEETINV
ncbi:restriction endonuclease subunit S [Undibacterium sp.]|uniref:restriction endonuclease subunit S n=1 Tax=Undibacterium sp. TaxID=1914977 RepID=UPI0037502C7F